MTTNFQKRDGIWHQQVSQKAVAKHCAETVPAGKGRDCHLVPDLDGKAGTGTVKVIRDDEPEYRLSSPSDRDHAEFRPEPFMQKINDENGTNCND